MSLSECWERQRMLERYLEKCCGSTKASLEMGSVAGPEKMGSGEVAETGTSRGRCSQHGRELPWTFVVGAGDWLDLQALPSSAPFLLAFKRSLLPCGVLRWASLSQ